MTKNQFLTLFILLFSVCTGYSQTASVKGKINTTDGKPAAYVNVTLKEIKKGTVTGEDGSYTLSNIKYGTYTLVISHTGLKTQEKSVTINSSQAVELDFSLNENAQQLDEVIVAARRSPNVKPVTVGKSGLSPMDMPQSVAIINTEAIQDQQMNRLSDVLKNVNGVAYGESRGSTNETFFARGYSLGGNNVLKNGARTSTGGAPEASTLESVEVLKGSAALLYGGVTGGAVVNLVTKKPKFQYGGEVSMRAGSYGLLKPTVDVYGPISKKLAFRTIATYEKANSFRDVVKTKRLYVNPSLLYKISDKTELLVQGDYLKSDYTPDFGIGSIGNKISPVGRNAFLNTLWAYNKTNTTSAQANLTHKFDDKWKLNLVVSYQNYNRDYFGAERPAANAFTERTARNLTRSQSKEDTYNEQLNITGSLKTFGINHTVLIGADADQSRTNAKGFAYAAGSSAFYDSIKISDPSTYNTHSEIPETYIVTNTLTPIARAGAFVQDLIAITDKFKVLAGVRWTYQRTSVTTIDSVLKNKQVNGAALAKIDQAFSPKFGFIYQPLKTTSVYISYANNFTSNSGINIETNSPMGPSIIDQYEAGIKNDFLSGKLSVNLTWYKIKNSRFAQTAAFTATGAVNADANLKEFSGKTASDGVELDITGTIVKGLNFMAGYSYNYMRYTETRNEAKTSTGATVAGGIVEGERLVGTTKNTANATLFYTFSSGVVKGLKLGASAFYTGDRFGGFNTSKTPSARAGLIPLKAFTTIDLSAGYSYKNFSILAKVSNITNEINYFVHENYSVNPIPPTQLIGTVSYRF